MKKFKEGDKVEIVGMDPSLRGDYEIGDICEIRDLNEEGLSDYTVFTKDRTDFWYFDEKELEKKGDFNE